MSYLFFRTDRIGDFLTIASLVNSIKRNDPKAKISFVCSKKNESLLKRLSIIDMIYTIDRKSITNKIELFRKLNKINYNTIFVLDKKNSSIVLGFFLKSKNKIFTVSKKFKHNFLKIFYNNVFLDNDFVNDSTQVLLKKYCNCIGYTLSEVDTLFFDKDFFKKDYNHTDVLNLDNLDYITVHYDEKWEIESYKESYSKGDTFTNIGATYDNFKLFLEKLSNKSNKQIIITTGLIKTNIVNDVIKNSKKLSENIYAFNLDNKTIYLIVNDNFFSTSYLISKSKTLITCHGAFTHIAFNYRIKIIDIIEENKLQHYNRITNHMTNYKSFFRSNFIDLSKKIINYI